MSPEELSQAHPGAVHRGDPVPSVPSYLNTFFKNLVDPVVVTDALGQITYVNGPLEQMLDMQAEALVGRHITELFVYQGSFITTAGQAIELGSGSLEESLAKVKQLFEEEKINYEYYCQRRDGLAVPVEVSVTMLSENNEDCRGAIVILRDISKRIRAFQEARQTRAQFKNLIECSINPIVFSDTVGIIIDCNSAFCDMIGYGREEIIGHMVTEFSIMSEGEYETTTADKVTVGADSIIAARRHIEQLFSEGKVSGWEALYRRKDGKLVPTISNVVLLKDDAGNMTGSFGIVQDITRECVTERELTRTKDFLDNIIANSPDGIVIADHNGHVTRVNAALLDMLGYEEDDMVGAYVGKFVPSQTGTYRSAAGDEVQIDEAYLKQNVQRSAELFQKGRGTNWESYVIHKSGTLVPVESSHMLIGGEQGGAARAVGICRDITGRRLAEKEKAHLAGQIQQTRKMESIATLAGGIAHDFNNLLLGITGNLELMKMKVPATAAARPYIELIQNAAGNMADLTNQLLAYARGGKYFVDKIDLNHLISNALYFMQENEEADILFQAELSSESPCVEADSTQIQMLVSAVVSNAVEACEGTGVISISTDCLQQRDCADRYPQLTPGSYVCVTVEDNGRGMTPEERSKMFEPFYTTKMQGRGLGMAAVYGIIKNHGGDICVDSVAGRGTRVSICLPVALQAPVKNIEPAALRDKEAATVLIVEDEEVIMELTTEFLEQEGYVVLKAATGKQALEMSDSYSGHIDIALLDIGLPDMSGAKLFPVLIEKRPDLKVIVCSGYSPDDPVQQSLKTEVKGFVQKPYPLKTLRQKIHDLLVVQ